MDTFYSQILTPDGVLFEGETTGVQMPGTLGSFEVKYNHANLVSTLDIGQVLIRRSDSDNQYIAVSGGVVEVTDNKLTLLAESAEKADEIDVERARKAKKRVINLLKEENGDREKLSKSLKKAENRLKVASKKD